MFRTIKYILVEFSHEVYAMFTFSAKCLFFICVRVIVLEIAIYKFLHLKGKTTIDIRNKDKMKLAICKMIYLSFITLPPERKIPEISYPNASTITFVATYVKIYAHFICGMTLQ
jgi:hypothetical protein